MKPKLMPQAFMIALAIIVVALSARAQDSRIANQEEPTPFPFTAVEDKLAPAGWKLYQFETPVTFSVFLPGRPQAFSKKFSSKNEGELIANLYLAPDEYGVYGLSYMTDLTARARPKSEVEKRIIFGDFISGFAESFRAGMKERGVTAQLEMGVQRKVSAGGIEGYEQDLTLGAYNGRARMVFVHQAACVAFALWRQESPVGNRTAFFDSFKVSPK